jgi:hypothetical protein
MRIHRPREGAKRAVGKRADRRGQRREDRGEKGRRCCKY